MINVIMIRAASTEPGHRTQPSTKLQQTLDTVTDNSQQTMIHTGYLHDTLFCIIIWSSVLC